MRISLDKSMAPQTPFQCEMKPILLKIAVIVTTIDHLFAAFRYIFHINENGLVNSHQRIPQQQINYSSELISYAISLFNKFICTILKLIMFDSIDMFLIWLNTLWYSFLNWWYHYFFLSFLKFHKKNYHILSDRVEDKQNCKNQMRISKT